MLKIASAIKAHRYLALILVVTLFGVLSGVVFGLSRRSRHAQSLAPAVTINNKTNAVRVLGSEKVNVAGLSVLSLKFQNVSNKDIKAVTITAGQMFVTQDLFLAEESIPQGSITTRIIPLSEEQLGLNGSSETVFTVAAVAFADGTGDGDAKLVNVLSDEYAGIRDQSKRIANKLRALSSGPDGESSLADLETQVNALPTTSDRPASPSYEEGLKNARQMLLVRLREIKDRRQSNNLAAAERKQEKLKMLFESFASASDSPK